MSFTSICIEYVWIDGDYGLRSKMKCITNINEENINLNDYEKLKWNYDGSSTDQAETKSSEVILNPVKLYENKYKDYQYYKEFGSNNIKHYLLLCESVNENGEAVKCNNYQYAKSIFDNEESINNKPWFGLEQEYFIINPKTGYPVGFDKKEYYNSFWCKVIKYIEPKEKQGKYYCGFNPYYNTCKKIAEKHMNICLMNGLQISGINAEVACGQWEYQIGPVEGIEAANQLWISRYLLLKVAEEEGYSISFEPKPITWGEWNGSGCHTNFSTEKMREGSSDGKNGMDYIKESMLKLEVKHKEHIEVYGTGNEMRLTGKYETSDINKFSYGIGSRNTSVRIGNQTAKEGKGYFEDRRPSSNMDPYLVCGKLVETIIIK